ncbi:MAG: general secretion pathway protein GspK [Burkholderiales bacterium]|nr:general secretion pathway protein GspK [Burkholderiales bacterium]
MKCPDGSGITGRRRAGPGAARQDGIALILVLWLTIMLTVIASGFAFSMHSEALTARNALSLAQARAAADGGIERMAFELSRPRYPTAWASDGMPHTWRDGDVGIVATAVDESARIDINSAPEMLLRGLLEHVGGADAETAARIVDAIADWRDPDDNRRPNGAEEADYRAAGLEQKPTNAPFETVAELARVMGMTPPLYARIANTLTVQSRQPGINATTAPRDVLLALPNATPEAVDAYLQQRAAALASKLPVPPFPPASGFAAGAVPVWRIRTVATAADGVTFARDAVVRPSGDGRRPLLTLSWQEGTTVDAPVTIDSAPGNDRPDSKSANGRQ